ncbi:hypothetical protein ELS19_14685 [Halogeometricum borinquense]|uniref:Uncharacterized protein n=1 Tax=Halogeometricum borinquense TaxID=60847 RepID=A0A482TIN5_9EURY|nr:hypothetical protein [Halogeometricum borinquense]RYJ15068.1 hypothetical protein ELS19_14685 [Halogeometricum borinquense]
MDSPPHNAGDDIDTGSHDDDSAGYDDDNTGYDDDNTGYDDDGTSVGTSPQTTDYEDPIGDLLPYASVDSNWWYWIAAPIALFVLSLVGGILFFVAFLFDILLTGGILSVTTGILFAGIASLIGLVLSVMFPVAVYVDARALCEAPESSWSPDPVLYGLVALAGVVVTAFTVSIPFGIYYLYRRHVAVGTP